MKIDDDILKKVRKIIEDAKEKKYSIQIFNEIEYEFQKELQKEKNKYLRLKSFLEEIGFDMRNNIIMIKKNLRNLEEWGEFLFNYNNLEKEGEEEG